MIFRHGNDLRGIAYLHYGVTGIIVWINRKSWPVWRWRISCQWHLL